MAQWCIAGISLATALAVASCSTTFPSGPVSLGQVTLPDAYGIYTPVAAHQVISDSSSWTQLWSAMTRSSSEPPAVDFSRDVVLFTTMGPEPTDTYHTKIQGATLDSHGRLLVAVSELSQNCNGGPVVTFPTDAMTVSRAFASHVVFQITRTGDSCGP